MAHAVFTPEQTAHNVKSAKEALASNDLAHALFHISSALASDPTNAEWRGMLDHIISRAPDALPLARLDEAKSDFITAATRAYILASKGQYVDAIRLVAEVYSVRPDAPFLVWAQEWIRRPGVAQSLPKEFGGELMALVLKTTTQAPCPMAEGDPRQTNVRALADIAAVLRHYLKPPEPFLLFGSSMILRRLGAWDEAIYYAHQALTLKADWNTAIGLACAYRDAKKVDEAVQTYRYAMSFDAEDLSARLDIGDTYLEAERYDDALGAYQEVLAKNADHPWARASVVYARFKKIGNPSAAQAEKRELFKLSEHNGRAWELLCRITPAQLYFTSHPGPGDATANAIRNVMNHIRENPGAAAGGSAKLNVTHPESPSVMSAFRLWTAANRFQIGIEIEVERVQTPDPRAPKGQSEIVLWAYQGTNARPNVPPPDPRAQEAIAQIAKEPYNLEFWEGPARALAGQMGAAWAHQLCFVMAHPPPLPNTDMDPFDWVLRCQVAVALVVGYIEEAWENSLRKRLLIGLALGPTDWANDAAIIVLAWLSRNDAAIRKDVEPLFGWLESQIPKEGFTCWEYPLVCAWIAMGNHPPEVAQRLEAWRDHVRTKAEKGEEETHQGLNLERYAELSVRRDEVVMKGAMGAGGALSAMMGGGSHPELAKLCKEYGIDASRSAAAGRIPEWDTRINDDPELQKHFFSLQADARLRMQGLDPGSHEGRVARMIREGSYDVEGQKVNAAAAAQQIAQGDGGDPDPVVFPGQRLERLSHYVALMKGMQTGDMMGALKRAGLDMGAYMQVAQAWGVKLASDPVLTAKFSQMMAK